jgi:hypothetical protein
MFRKTVDKRRQLPLFDSRGEDGRFKKIPCGENSRVEALRGRCARHAGIRIFGAG